MEDEFLQIALECAGQALELERKKEDCNLRLMRLLMNAVSELTRASEEVEDD